MLRITGSGPRLYAFLLKHFRGHASEGASSRGAVVVVHSRLATDTLPGEVEVLRKGERPAYIHLFNRSGTGITGFHYDPLFRRPAPASSAPGAPEPKAPPRSAARSPARGPESKAPRSPAASSAAGALGQMGSARSAARSPARGPDPKDPRSPAANSAARAPEPEATPQPGRPPARGPGPKAPRSPAASSAAGKPEGKADAPKPPTAAEAMTRERSGALLKALQGQASGEKRATFTLARAMDGFYFVGTMAAARVEFRSCVNMLQRDGAIKVHWKKKELSEWVIEVLKRA